MDVDYTIPLRSTGTAYLWWFFLGVVGAHKFYLGRPLIAIFYVCTAGGFTIGLIYDLFTLPSQVRTANELLIEEGRSLGLMDA